MSKYYNTNQTDVACCSTPSKLGVSPVVEPLEQLAKPIQLIDELSKVHSQIHDQIVTLKNRIKPVIVENPKPVGAGEKGPKTQSCLVNERLLGVLGEASDLLDELRSLTEDIDL